MIQPIKHEFETVAISNLNVESIRELIEGQAQLHTTDFNGDVTTLKEHFVREQKRSRENRAMQLLNGLMKTYDDKPIAYLMYYPAFDQYGRFGLYGEDIYVDNDYRHLMIGHSLLCELSEMAVQKQGCFLEWVTDLRNSDFRKYIKRRMSGKKADKINFDASIMTQSLPFCNGVDSKYVTRPIRSEKEDADALSKVGINRQLADHSSDYPIVGFITYNKDTNTAAAVTVANLRYSTFQTKWGLVLEPSAFAKHVRNDSKSEILKSVSHGIRDFCNDTNTDLNISTINWYVSRFDRESIRVLAQEFGLKYDQIAHNSEQDPHYKSSKMVPHYLDKERLKRLANFSGDIPSKRRRAPANGNGPAMVANF